MGRHSMAHMCWDVIDCSPNRPLSLAKLWVADPAVGEDYPTAGVQLSCLCLWDMASFPESIPRFLT